MRSNEAKRIWVQAQPAFIQASQNYEQVRTEKPAYPDPAKYPDTPHLFWAEADRMDSELAARVEEAKTAMARVQERLEDYFAKKCQDLILKERTLARRGQ